MLNLSDWKKMYFPFEYIDHDPFYIRFIFST